MGRPRSHNHLPGGSSILWKMVPDFSENDNTVTTCEADTLSYYNIYVCIKLYSGHYIFK